MSEELMWCYKTLGVRPESSRDEIRCAYKDLVLVWHPDRFSGQRRLQEKAQEMLKDINRAFATLEAHWTTNENSNHTSRPKHSGRPSEGTDEDAREREADTAELITLQKEIETAICQSSRNVLKQHVSESYSDQVLTCKDRFVALYGSSTDLGFVLGRQNDGFGVQSVHFSEDGRSASVTSYKVETRRALFVPINKVVMVFCNHWIREVDGWKLVNREQVDGRTGAGINVD